jgi:hypothetical protein
MFLLWNTLNAGKSRFSIKKYSLTNIIREISGPVGGEYEDFPQFCASAF